MTAVSKLRRKLNVTQGAFAKVARVTQATVSRWESGELEPGLPELRRLRSAYGDDVDIEALLKSPPRRKKKLTPDSAPQATKRSSLETRAAE